MTNARKSRARHAAAYGAGVRYEPPPRTVRDRRTELADQPGRHLWVMTAAWKISDPAAWSSSTAEPVTLDSENIVMFAGPGCLKCEQEYSAALAARPCTGSVD